MLKRVDYDYCFAMKSARKKVKLNIATDSNYNEFNGDLPNEDDIVELRNNNIEKARYDMGMMTNFTTIEQYKTRYKYLYYIIKQQYRKIKKICDVLPTGVKLYQKTYQPQSTKPIKANKKPINQSSTTIHNKSKNISSNWKQFLKYSSSNTLPHKSYRTKINPLNVKSYFVAIDCEFVKCAYSEQLGRISIISSNGTCLYDSYIRPYLKITDYLTHISGITFIHIRQAPTLALALPEIKKHLYNKMVIGHTVAKDIEICGLTNWTGIKKLIDISMFEKYKYDNGRLISLKNLAMKHLGKNIQEGWHSSVYDAQVTMELFNLNKKSILKELGVL